MPLVVMSPSPLPVEYLRRNPASQMRERTIEGNRTASDILAFEPRSVAFHPPATPRPSAIDINFTVTFRSCSTVLVVDLNLRLNSTAYVT